MKRLALAFLLVLASYSVSSAQQPIIVYSPASGTSQPQFPVTSTNPFPVVCESGCSGGGSSGAVFGPTAAGSPAANPPVLIGGTIDGTATGNVDNWKVVSGVGFVNCANCSGSGVSQTDEAAFTAGTSLFAPGGGFFQTTATNNPLANGQQGLWQMTANRAGFVNLRNASGTEIGTAAVPVQVSVANTGANATALLTTGTGGTFPATQSGTWNITNISGTVSLPTGAATSALQSTINTTLGTPMQNSGGSVTANIGTLNGAATAANQGINNTDATGSGSLTGTGTVSAATNGAATITASASGTGTGLAFSFQGQMPDASWVAVNAYPIPASGQNGSVTSGTANGEWQIPAAGFSNVRVNLTAITGGTETFNLRASVAPQSPATDAAIGSGVPKSMIVCDSYAKYDASTTGDTQIVAASGSTSIYVCGYAFHVGGTATNVKLDYGTGTNCGTGNNALTPAWQLLANAGRVVAPGIWSGLKTPASQAVCVNASGANAVQAEVWYTQF